MSFVLWEILLPLIIAFLLGLLFGWLWWGWRRTKITYSEWETMRQKASRASSTDVDAELTELRTDRDRLQAEIDNHVCVVGDASAGDAAVGAGVLGLSSEADADAGSSGADASDAGSSGADAAGGDGGERAVDGPERHPYGEGSHAPFGDDARAMPDGYVVKGNADSMLYHRPDSRVYDATVAEVWFDTPERAEANGFALAKSHPTDSSASEADGSGNDGASEDTDATRPVIGGTAQPYGDGSHAPFSDDKRAMPEGFPVKGNVDSMLYHREDSRNYRATVAEVWFSTPEAAEAAGFALSPTHPS